MASHPLCPWCLPATGRCSVRNRWFHGIHASRRAHHPVPVVVAPVWRSIEAHVSRTVDGGRGGGQARELQALVAARVRGQADIAVPSFLYPWLSTWRQGTCSPRDMKVSSCRGVALPVSSFVTIGTFRSRRKREAPRQQRSQGEPPRWHTQSPGGSPRAGSKGKTHALGVRELLSPAAV